MSIEVIYQGLSIAKDARFRLQDGGVFVQLEGPMPVATRLSLRAGDHSLAGKVRRVVERTEGGSGMLVGPAEGTRLPRWLKQLDPEIHGEVEFEPEAPPPPPPAPVVEAKQEPAADSPAKQEAQHEAKSDAKQEAQHEAKADAESQKSPAPAEGEHASEEEEEEGKPAAKGDGKKAPKAKKKSGGRRR